VLSLGKGYQTGIISSITMSPSSNIIAAGSFNRDIGLYDDKSHEQISFLKHAHKGGITQLKFINDNHMVSAARKSPELKVYNLKITSYIYKIF
jgi:WD40 repeat protein